MTLQQKRRLADAGVAADQGDASLHKPASHDSVEFAESRHGAGDLLDRHVGEVLQGARRVDEAACGARGARTVAAAMPCATLNSWSVFQALQCGHCPCHLAVVPPHSLQTNSVLVLVVRGAIGCRMSVVSA